MNRNIKRSIKKQHANVTAAVEKIRAALELPAVEHNQDIAEGIADEEIAADVEANQDAAEIIGSAAEDNQDAAEIIGSATDDEQDAADEIIGSAADDEQDAADDERNQDADDDDNQDPDEGISANEIEATIRFEEITNTCTFDDGDPECDPVLEATNQNIEGANENLTEEEQLAALPLKKFLAYWISKYNIARTHANVLLKYLSAKYPDENLPRDYRKILSTPKETVTRKMAPNGDYTYIGIEEGLRLSCFEFSKYPEGYIFTMQVNTDGATVSNFSLKKCIHFHKS